MHFMRRKPLAVYDYPIITDVSRIFSGRWSGYMEGEFQFLVSE